MSRNQAQMQISGYFQRSLEDFEIFRKSHDIQEKNCDISEFCNEKSTEIMFFLGRYFNANQGMGTSVTKIQPNLHIWACCNLIQQYSPVMIYATQLTTKWLMTYPLSRALTQRQCLFQTTVGLQPPAKSLSGTLPVLKCGTLVFLQAEGYCVNKAVFMWNRLEFCCMLYKNIIS